MAKKQSLSGFGHTRQLPSGNWQASHPHPYDKVLPTKERRRVNAPHTFGRKLDALNWLDEQYTAIQNETWMPPGTAKSSVTRSLTFGEYAPGWLERRRNSAGKPLARSTKDQYAGRLRNYLLPTFGDRPMAEVTQDDVHEWYEALPESQAIRTACYILLHSIFEDAVEHDRRIVGHIGLNPVKIRGGASYTSDPDQVEPATPAQVAAIAAAMPDRHRLMVLLGAWCALRFGEAAALRRCDIDAVNGLVHVRQATTRVGGVSYLGEPKAGSRRTVAIPAHIIDAVKHHLNTYVTGREGLLFPSESGELLTSATFYGERPYTTLKGKEHPGTGYNKARFAAGRGDLNFHALRHTGATWAGQSGATLAELMARLGHKSQKVAMRYQHASAQRDRELADRMSANYLAWKADQETPSA